MLPGDITNEQTVSFKKCVTSLPQSTEVCGVLSHLGGNLSPYTYLKYLL